MAGCYAPFLGHSWYTVDRFNSERWTICSGDILIRFVCLLAKHHAAFKRKDAISGIPISKGSAEGSTC